MEREPKSRKKIQFFRQRSLIQFLIQPVLNISIFPPLPALTRLQCCSEDTRVIQMDEKLALKAFTATAGTQLCTIRASAVISQRLNCPPGRGGHFLTRRAPLSDRRVYTRILMSTWTNFHSGLEYFSFKANSNPWTHRLQRQAQLG